jgi:hypothetical protein
MRMMERFRRVSLTDEQPHVDRLIIKAIDCLPEIEAVFSEILIPFERFVLACLLVGIRERLELEKAIRDLWKNLFHPPASV